MIVEGRLAPGAKINEADLAEQFGVSRTPLRESLKVLAADGLVAIRPNRGAWVAEMTAADLEPHYQVLAVLEGLAGELAAAQITAAELAAVRALQAAMEEAWRAGDLHVYFGLNQQIHAAILTAARNPALAAAHRALSLRLMATRYRVNLSPARWAEAVREHQVILGLLELRHAGQLGAVLRAHILKKLEALKSRQDHTEAHPPPPRERQDENDSHSGTACRDASCRHAG
jgi:DNA-binding GntR family transcriptional regulator